jgi:hypothetical protein
MGTVTFLAPANPQWVGLELKMMGVLRRLLGNESPFGWCDFITSTEPSGPCAEFCDHFGPVVRLSRVDRPNVSALGLFSLGNMRCRFRMNGLP